MRIWFKPKTSQATIDALKADKEALVLARMELDSSIELIDKKIAYFHAQEKSKEITSEQKLPDGMVAAR